MQPKIAEKLLVKIFLIDQKKFPRGILPFEINLILKLKNGEKFLTEFFTANFFNLNIFAENFAEIKKKLPADFFAEISEKVQLSFFLKKKYFSKKLAEIKKEEDFFVKKKEENQREFFILNRIENKMQKIFGEKKFAENLTKNKKRFEIARVAIAAQIKRFFENEKKYVLGSWDLFFLEIENQQIEKFLADPALQNLEKINLSAIPAATISKLKKQTPIPEKTNLKFSGEEIFRANLQVAICRNLFFENLPPTAENIKNAAEKIFAAREKFWNKKIFRDRNVIFAANNENKNKKQIQNLIEFLKIEKCPREISKMNNEIEKLKNEFHFGNENLQKMIEADGPQCFEFFRAEKNPENLRETSAENFG